ncbi:METTL5 family protein [Natronoarchaeum mannanilyticum]|uniref:METTL5 family protein n=3 Tax=Natronoarchaeum mannanilyticum TaxID=926360 RepID=A0AAV3TBM5_9EURY
MSTKRQLAQQLAVVAGFESPSAELEQYPTPPELAAHLIHVADLQGDVEDRTVVDLGTGTGMLALGAALRGPRRVVGVDVDRGALTTAQANERRVGTASEIGWVQADATRAPLAVEDATVVMNPPFGAQDGNEHADRAFLETASEIAAVSYSIHNEDSDEFVEAFAADNGGEVTHAFRAELDIERQFEFHDADSEALDAEVFRIEWS